MDKKFKIFISTPMNGRTKEEVEERFHIVSELFFQLINLDPAFQNKVKRADIHVIDTYNKEEAPDWVNNDRVYYLGDSIKQLSSADLVIFDYNWGTARGCSVECDICDLYGIPYFEIGSSKEDLFTLINFIKLELHKKFFTDAEKSDS